MDFKQFSASLGDFVLGTQILKDNLSAILKQKASGLDDFLTSESFLRSFGPSMVEELKGLVQEKDFFLEEVAWISMISRSPSRSKTLAVGFWKRRRSSIP